MQFGRVYGFVARTSETDRWLTVVLDTGRELRTVRDEAVQPALLSEDSAWLADQLVQETIGVELAEEGWEVVGQDTVEGEREGEHHAIARSLVYVVRRL